VTEDRLHRAGQDAPPTAIARWARSAMGLGGDPPLRKARPPRHDPIRRTWLGAFWHARIAVRAGILLDDYLRSRLACYLASLPVPSARLPLAVEVEDGQLAVRPLAAPAPDRSAAADAWLDPLVAVEGPAIRQEVSELEVRLALLDGQVEAARRRSAELTQRLAADVAAGIVTGPAEVNATAEQLGRPTVRSHAPRTLALGFAGAALAAETWQVARPLLRAAGVDPSAVGTEVLRRPADVVFAAVFALGVAVGLFALAHVGIVAALAVFKGAVDDRRRPSLGVAALGAVSLASLVAVAVAALPPPLDGSQPPAEAFVLLLLAVPLAAALVVRAARRADELRDQDLAAALAWDRERARALAERQRRLEELDWAEEGERALERHREAARRRLKEVNARAVTAGRLAAEAERSERADLSRLAHTLVGALELDRYEFVRQAAARGAQELVAPRRRKPAPEPRPAFDEVTAPVAAPTPVAVEASRMAS
jgi:hypothetical protein